MPLCDFHRGIDIEITILLYNVFLFRIRAE